MNQRAKKEGCINKRTFIERYDDESNTIAIFFKHIDENTSIDEKNYDFFRFYNLEKRMIQESVGEKDYYAIPEETAPLLALMIKCHKSIREYKSEKNGVDALDQYCRFVKSIEEGLGSLPDYQKAFIQSFKGYKSARIITDLFPMLIEKLSRTLLSFFNVDQQTNDIMWKIDLLSDCLEDVLFFNVISSQRTPLSTYDEFYEKTIDERKDLMSIPEYSIKSNAFMMERVLRRCYLFFTYREFAPRLEIIDSPEYIQKLFWAKLKMEAFPDGTLMGNNSELFAKVYSTRQEELTESIKQFETRLAESKAAIDPERFSCKSWKPIRILRQPTKDEIKY